MGSKKKEKAPSNIAANNRKARHLYHILETVQAGLVLQGTEVKALREGKGSLVDSYAVIINGEAYLQGCHISEYSHANIDAHPTRRRIKLLLHKREIAKLAGKVSEKGLTLVPLKIYFDRGLAKADIALCRGKQLHDKRHDIKKRDQDMDMKRELAGRY